MAVPDAHPDCSGNPIAGGSIMDKYRVSRRGQIFSLVVMWIKSTGYMARQFPAFAAYFSGARLMFAIGGADRQRRRSRGCCLLSMAFMLGAPVLRTLPPSCSVDSGAFCCRIVCIIGLLGRSARTLLRCDERFLLPAYCVVCRECQGTTTTLLFPPWPGSCFWVRRLDCVRDCAVGILGCRSRRDRCRGRARDGSRRSLSRGYVAPRTLGLVSALLALGGPGTSQHLQRFWRDRRQLGVPRPLRRVEVGQN